jgi:hypothetical protein
MEVGRREAGGPALMVLAVDTPVAADVMGRIDEAIGATRSRYLSLP